MQALEPVHLLIKQSTQHIIRRALSSHAGKEIVPAIRESFESFLLASFRVTIAGQPREVDELEGAIAHQMRAQVIIHQPQDLPAQQSLSKSLQTLGFHSDPALEGIRSHTVTECGVELVLEHTVTARIRQVLIRGAISNVNPTHGVLNVMAKCIGDLLLHVDNPLTKLLRLRLLLELDWLTLRLLIGAVSVVLTRIPPVVLSRLIGNATNGPLGTNLADTQGFTTTERTTTEMTRDTIPSTSSGNGLRTSLAINITWV